MERTLIKLVYKQVIDTASTGNFERAVFEATYDEFKMKSQAYNPEGKFKTFTELKANDGRANSLHYKISFAAGHLVEILKNKIPGLTDNLGNAVIFDVAKFELIESDIENKDAHKLAINYTTDTLLLCKVIGEYMVLSNDHISTTEPVETYMLKLQPNLAITEYQVRNQSILNTFYADTYK